MFINIGKKLGITSWGAIIHIIVVEIIINLIWNWVSKGFETILVREIGFLVLVIAVIFAIAWYLPKLSPKLGGASKQSGIITDYTSLSRHWLEQALIDDKDNLGSRIYGRDYQCLTDGLNKTDPYIEVTVNLINAHVFPILVTGVSGRLSINGDECAFAVEMATTIRILHGESSNVRMKQRLTREMIQSITLPSWANIPFKVGFQSCQFKIQPEIEGEHAEPTSIGLTAEIDVQIPH